ncbi:MAG: RluA family pseudouridine synthase [Desulfosalsimonas sp.]|uniref:RluA family pseudouridine synthase n=1 Tax=Desulfosalsimonas sp. TaxID=3073848 RepID=UPI003970C424
MTRSDGPHVTLVAGADQAGLRLDQFVTSMVPGCSRNTAANWIKKQQVLVGGAVKKPGYRVNAGDIVSVPPRVPESISAIAGRPITPEPLALDLLYVDTHIVVINKPPGMVVHPAAGNLTGTIAHGLAFHFPEIQNIGSEPSRPGIVHRLDKDTSGILVAARTQAAWTSLTRQFQQRTVEKTYNAFVLGNPEKDCGRITLPVFRHPGDRKKMAAAQNPDLPSRHAETRWLVVQRFAGASRLECQIRTGRTHQIRVHLAAIGHPVIGDAVYGCRRAGKACRSFPDLKRIYHQSFRQMLHARHIVLNHPQSGRILRMTAPLPDDMLRLQKAMEKDISG